LLAEDGQKDPQDWMIISPHQPKLDKIKASLLMVALIHSWGDHKFINKK